MYTKISFIQQLQKIAALSAIACWIVIVFASLYPFTGWQMVGESPFEFLSYPYPYYTRGFDNFINALIYVPYGFAVAYIPAQKRYGILLALFLGLMTSVSVEVLQVFLPNRIASNLDITYNVLGALVGSLLARGPLMSKIWYRLIDWRRQYFLKIKSADTAILLIAAWFLTEINPSIPLFGIVVQRAGLPQPFESPIADPVLYLYLIEVIGAALNTISILLLFLCFWANRKHSLQLILIILGLAWSLKLFFAALLLENQSLFNWINLNTFTGITIGFLISWGISRISRVFQAIILIICALGIKWLMYLWPLKESLEERLVMFNWKYGHLSNINALGDFTTNMWPWALILCMASFLIRERQRRLRQLKYDQPAE